MSPEILQGVLLTVQRLEATLDGLQGRLRVLELSKDGNLQQQARQEAMPPMLPAAADYQKSVQRLRQLYEFDSLSAHSLPEENLRSFDEIYHQATAGHGASNTHHLQIEGSDYGRPMSSVYFSRYPSRLEIPAFPAELQVLPETTTPVSEFFNPDSASPTSSRISSSSGDTHITTPTSSSSGRISLDYALRVLKNGDGRLKRFWNSSPSPPLSPTDGASPEIPEGLSYDDVEVPSEVDAGTQVKTVTKRQVLVDFGNELGHKATVVRKKVTVRMQKAAFGAGRALMNQQLRKLDARS